MNNKINTTKKTNIPKIPDEEIKSIKKVKEYKLICESNIVSILWKDVDLYFDYDSLNLNQFTYNEWKVYFQIGQDIVVKEKKPILDEITVNLYLEKHEKLKSKYDEYGGFATIEKAKEYVKVNNIEGYISELNKWNTVINLVKNRFPIADRLSEYVDMTSEEIYDEYEAVLNHIFINSASSGCKTSYLADGIHDLIEELDVGYAVGLPLFNMPILTHEIGGLSCGNITLIGD
jgi:replicative DNA helicase